MRISRAGWVTVSVIGGSLLLTALLRNGARAGAEGQGAPTPAGVRVVPLRQRAIVGDVRAGGFLRAQEDITISAERAGRVVALPVPEGSDVSTGQVVASLDDTIASADLAQARAAAREAGLEPNLGAAELERARAALARATHEFRLHHPASPIRGTVEVHHVDVGEYVVPGTPLVDVLDMRALILDVDLDPEIVALDFKVTVEGKPVKVRRIANRADPKTRRFRVELELEPGRFSPGMYAEARFELPATGEAYFLPKAAVRRLHGEPGVYVVRSGKARWLPVKVAEVHHEPALWRVVRGGFVDGDALVTGGFSGLRDGVAVEVER